MAPRETRILHALADAVVEGEAVDWDAALRRLRSASAQGVASGLQALASITPPEGRRARVAVRRVPRWQAAHAALTVVQVLAGLLALLWVPRDAGPIPPALLAINAVAFCAAALVLPRLRPSEARLRDLAGTFFAIAAACSHRPLRWLVEAGHGAWPLVLLRGLLPDAFLAFFLWRLVRAFPRVQRLSASDGVIRLFGRLGGCVGVVLFACNAVAYVRDPVRPWEVPVLGVLARPHPSGLYWLLQFGLAAVALAMVAWRSRRAEAGERPRIAVFGAGLLVGLGPLFLIILLEFSVHAARLYIEGPGLRLVGFAIYLPLATVPLTTGYALVAVRPPALASLTSAAKLLLGRRVLAFAAAVPLAVLAFFVYVHRERSTAVVLGGPLAATLATISGLAMLGLFLRDRLGGRLHPESRMGSVLVELTAAIRAAPTLSEAAESAVSHLRRRTRAEAAALLVRAESRRRFEARHGEVRPLPLDSAIRLLAEEGDQVLFADPRDPASIFGWLPAAEQEWVVDSAAAAIAGVRGGSSDLLAILVLGPKEDGGRWTSADGAFLAAAAAAAGLALEARGLGRAAIGTGPLVAEGSALECGLCGRVLEPSLAACTCGGPLTESRLPPVLRGKFRVERVLGRGGMGVVYAGVDLDLQRPVALKTLPGVTASAALRLRREARSMAAWVHPHLAVIFGAESWRGVPVLVVECLEGGTLAQRLPGPLPAREVLAWGAALAGALDAMHGRGVLHRDVKPSNIGFTASGVPKLLDFGLARLVGEPEAGAVPRLDKVAADAGIPITRTGHIVGTPLYMSPHVRAGGEPGPADDVWSLVLVLQEAIAGYRPWAEPAAERAVPAPLRAWFAAALDPRPGTGMRSAGQLRQELERLGARIA